MRMHILVTGGAGYIGSHMVKRLLAEGMAVTVADDLSNGRACAVQGARLAVGDIGDAGFIGACMAESRPDAVIHFAGFIEVGASVVDPARFYRNNVSASLVLLDAMRTHGVERLIFSSTAAIFGQPRYSPIDEAHPCAPINPYGRSKWMLEQVLEDYARAYGLRATCLRYFNAAGADPDGALGECHEPETHLVPLVLQVASGRRREIAIFGDDYDTPDGTCIRDYIHVEDLCDAHLRALRRLAEGADGQAFNLGNGQGFSVREVIEAARRVTGHPIPAAIHPRRPGDPPRLVADATRAREVLGWTPRHADLDTIIGHAWAWERRYPAWSERSSAGMPSPAASEANKAS